MNEQTLALLRAAVKSLIIEANERLGDENPYAALEIDALGERELGVAKRYLHELLYAPPG
jgi:hypothetical protein